MKELKSGLLTAKYTRVFHEDEAVMKYNAPHHFHVLADAGQYAEPLADIDFQEGPIKECGVNGVANEDLINMVICRLEHFQRSEYACRENALAITKLEESLMWLRKRTMDREARGVEGTHTV
jgi:hypothetical protein